ncbi:glycoside hydrolase family 10 protein [Brasilonema sennae CENA114]|uniref:Glycoside hydrolase family 10 protein n=1 Tax=Brasilonema sennae CENA114 TaxID=415709 RepID=A0A856MMI8_9CYAN|nr:family 10 glycosylhydrolase [Brasilonema sennae]QDL11732.1 glycoside hydrolase family 10 protein [Brasilonema sennae CENA114]
MRNQKRGSKKIKSRIQKAGFLILNFNLLIFHLLNILPATAATSEPVLSIVQSDENANQWTGITNRLQTAGVKYCVIPLSSVRSAADWGDRTVLFLPNVESLTPTQAIALEEWMSKGGRLIASGPVGSLSAPGVRQLLRSILGGYWGFSLDKPQKLEPSPKAKFVEWANQNGLFGQVRGGVVIADNATTTAAAIWGGKDNPAAVVANERSTLFGWRWGVDAASPAQLDTAWLQTTIKRFLKRPSSAPTKVAGGSQTCSTTVAKAPATPTGQKRAGEAGGAEGAGEQGSRGVGSRGGYTTITSSSSPSSPSPPSPPSPAPPPKIATAPQPRPIPSITPPKSEEAIDQLEQRVRFDVVPNSQAPISRNEALTYQHELENLIGRVESANLAALALSENSNNPALAKTQQAQVASTRPGATFPRTEQALDAAREVVKNLPELIAQKNYAQARQQWLMARANLWNQFPLNKRLAQPEIRAMWLDRGTIIRAGSEQRLAEIFDRIAQAGINTIFFETVNAGYTIYPSKIAPQENPLVRNWDPLASAVKLAHERGIELHAWVWTFAAGNERHNRLLNINPNYPGPVLAAHPDWAGYDNRGQMIPSGQTKPFFDPANPQVRQYLLSLYEEIVSRYDVDGLQLDYIRYPFQDPSANRTYGYGKAAREQFQQLTGTDPAKISPRQQQLWQKWTEFRTQQIDSFVAQVSQLRQKRPNLILSAAVFPLPEQERIQKLQQHWEVWARRGDIDLIVPMTYAQDTPRFERLAQPWITTATQLGSSLLVPGIRLLSLQTVGAFDQIQLVRDLPVAGYALFAAQNFTNDLNQVFNNTQGSPQRTQKEPIPHRQPFQTAWIRYTTLQREWKFAQQNNQLRITSTTLSTLNSQAEVVQSALNQLATNPDNTKLATARTSLLRLQSQFRELMRLQALENPYQVRVWENRLATIEKLLRYGERVQLHRSRS